MGPLFAHYAYPGDDAYDHHNAELVRSARYLLLSHSAFAGMRDYWTGVPADPKATAIRRELAGLFQKIDKLVDSDRMTPAAVTPWDNTRIVPRAAAYETIGRLKQDGDILVMLSRL